MTISTFLVLVTGHAAAGKTTLAPRLAEELGAIWISRDTIHSKVYSGWEPAHPALTSDQYDPQINGNTYFEGRVVWDLFLWMLGTVTPHHSVVADTPFNHPWNREMFAQQSLAWRFPVVEVALHGDPATLLSRARRRADQPDVHEIKRRFSVRPTMYEEPYRPVLDASRVIEVDTTNLDDLNSEGVANAVRTSLGNEQTPRSRHD